MPLPVPRGERDHRMPRDDAGIHRGGRHRAVRDHAGPVRLGEPHQRRVVGAEACVVALAPVDVADKGLVRVAPSHPALPVDVHRAPVGAYLGEDLVLADEDPLVGQGHRRRRLLAAQRMVLVIESNARDDVGLAHDHVDGMVGRGRSLLEVVADRVELLGGQSVRIQGLVVRHAVPVARDVDPVKRRRRHLIARRLEDLLCRARRIQPALQVRLQREQVAGQELGVRHPLPRPEKAVVVGASQQVSGGITADAQAPGLLSLSDDTRCDAGDVPVDGDEPGLHRPVIAQSRQVERRDSLRQRLQAKLSLDLGLRGQRAVERLLGDHRLAAEPAQVARPDGIRLGLPPGDGVGATGQPEHSAGPDHDGRLRLRPLPFQGGEVGVGDPVVAHVGPSRVERLSLRLQDVAARGIQEPAAAQRADHRDDQDPGRDPEMPRRPPATGTEPRLEGTCLEGRRLQLALLDSDHGFGRSFRIC